MVAESGSPFPPCLDCAGQAGGRLANMFIDPGQKGRPVFRKLHGIAHGKLEPLPNLDEQYKTGFLARGILPAWVRFSSDIGPTDPDLNSTIGIGIKLFGVPGRNALGEDGATADLIMQNYPVFFVDDARTMCEFTYAGTVLRDYPGYLAQHPRTREILDDMAKVEGSVLTATYWGILPFRLGGQVVKYRLDPEAAPQNVANDTPDYLATDLAARLAKGDYHFRLMVQKRTSDTMPLDAATVAWSEAESPFVPVATLILPRQDIGAPGQAAYGQSLAYNIWRVPEANAPVPESSLAAVRKTVYAASAVQRHINSGQPVEDPLAARPAAPAPNVPDHCIVRAVIHPAIGVARVGSSPDGWFIGPEVPDPAPLPRGAYRDAAGRLKRQAARFRIYGVNIRGDVIRELTGPGSEAEITWTVRLANTKAAWYGFQLALDIPEAAAAPPTTLRNPTVADRRQLAITPGARSVTGRDAAPLAFDDGCFMGKQVYLGEIRTDEAGRLIVLGGHGKSASYDGSWAVTFANNEGWHDDVSDGPVTAQVRLDGHDLPVTPAWIVVAPPNYGPQRKSVRTMWDLMRDVAFQAGTLPRPAEPSFTDDILPIFQRMAGLQWVNAGFAAGFGWNGLYDMSSPEGIARLADAGSATAEYRRTIANQFRRFATDSWSPVPWPWLYGDAMNVPPAKTPRQHSTLTDTQLAFLDQWAMGRFRADYDPGTKPPATIDQVPVHEQPDMLTRAALEFCLADAFHPGCEMTWPVRSPGLYMGPFRIAHAPVDWKPVSYGAVLTSDALMTTNGPLGGQFPGGLTQWMAVPWQTDTASCRSGYTPTYDPYVPTFWPARVPNEVLTDENYRIVCDTNKPMGERLAAFANRAAWIAPLGTTSYTDQINNMVAHFDHLGVVECREGPADGNFPTIIEVEDQHKLIHDVIPKPHPAEVSNATQANGPAVNGTPVRPHRIDLGTIEKVRRFPHGLDPVS